MKKLNDLDNSDKDKQSGEAESSPLLNGNDSQKDLNHVKKVMEEEIHPCSNLKYIQVFPWMNSLINGDRANASSVIVEEDKDKTLTRVSSNLQRAQTNRLDKVKEKIKKKRLIERMDDVNDLLRKEGILGSGISAHHQMMIYLIVLFGMIFLIHMPVVDAFRY